MTRPSYGLACFLAMSVALLFFGRVEGGSVSNPIGAHVVEETFREQAIVVLATVGIVLWFFVLGSMVGSYLNVVAYRLPIGRNLSWPPSSCPICNARIRPTDNVPIIGWLRLRGRCRNCDSPISLRYPLVEAGCGAMFLALAFAELFNGGANLPFRTPDALFGVIWNVLYFSSDAIVLYFFHAVLFATLLAVALIDRDRGPMPWKTILLWMAPIAAAGSVIYPPLQLAPLWREGMLPDRPDALLQSVSGGVLGALLGFCFWPRHQWTAVTTLSLIGFYTGWQSVFVASVASGAIHVYITAHHKGTYVTGFVFLAVAFTHHLIWRPWTESEWLPSGKTHAFWWLGWISLALYAFSVQIMVGMKKGASTPTTPDVVGN